MDLVADVLSWALIVIGAAFSLIGAVGMHRMPDFFTRIHAASLTDTMGAMMMLGGLGVQALTGAHWMSLIKLSLILAFILFTSPVSTHALAVAALRGGVRPGPCDDRTGGALAARDGTEDTGGAR